MAALACHAPRADAQFSNPFAVLSIPSGTPLRCRTLSTAANSPPGAQSGSHFELGDPRGRYRSIRIWYDSAGSAVALTETTMPDSARADSFIQSATVTFMKGDAAGFVIERDMASGADRRPAAPTEPPLLTPSQRKDALALAAWLHDRRCGPSGIDPGER